MDNISVLIGSCDSYSHLWQNFNKLFQKYWKLETKNYFVGETIFLPFDGYVNIIPGRHEWGKRILTGLDQVKTEYVWFILEDYYITEPITKEFIQEHINILEEYNADKIMVDWISHGEYKLTHLKDDLYQFNNDSNYLNSVQPSIWKTSYLKQVLRPEYSPWDFELKGNTFTSTLNPKILVKARTSPIYFNYARVGGKLSDGWEQIFKKENLKQ